MNDGVEIDLDTVDGRTMAFELLVKSIFSRGNVPKWGRDSVRKQLHTKYKYWIEFGNNIPKQEAPDLLAGLHDEKDQITQQKHDINNGG
jgi:hypothetical protein